MTGEVGEMTDLKPTSGDTPGPDTEAAPSHICDTPGPESEFAATQSQHETPNPRPEGFSPEELELVLSTIQRNDLQELRRCLEAFAEEDRPKIFNDKKMKQSVHHCLRHDNTDVMDFLLQVAPGIVDAVNEEGLTPLYQAAHLRKPNFVNRLLDSGASVQVTEAALTSASCGTLPFIRKVIKCEDSDLIRRVVQAGADVNADIGVDCVHAAARHCDLDTFQYVRDKSGRTASVETLAACAFSGRHVDTVKELMKKKHDRSLMTAWLVHKALRMVNTTLQEVLEMLKEIGGETLAIIFLEVYGAHLITKGNLQRGIDAWKAAMRLRWKNSTSNLPKEHLEDSMENLLETAEIQTMEDVENLPLHRLQLLKNAALILRRYFAPFNLYCEPMLCLVEELIVAGEIHKGIEIMKHIPSRKITELTLRNIVRVLRLAASTNSQDVSVELFLPKLTCCINQIQVGLNRTGLDETREHDPTSPLGKKTCYFCRSIKTAINSFVVLLSLLSELEKNSRFQGGLELHQMLRNFVLLCSKQRQEVLFHTMNDSQSLHPAAVKTLVAVSDALWKQAETSCPLHLTRDKEGRTPLHIYAQTWSKQKLIDDGILKCFLDNGADLCTRDNRGDSIRDILLARNFVTGGEVLPSLQCLAARLVAGMPPDLLSSYKNLGDFVLKH